MCRHYRGSLAIIAPVLQLRANPEQTITQQEDADRRMENKETRQGENNSTTAWTMAAWAMSAVRFS